MVLTRSANKQQENGTLDLGQKQQQPKINHFFKQRRNGNESDGDEDDGNNPSRKRLIHSSNSVRTRRSAAVAANFAIQEQTPRRVLSDVFTDIKVTDLPRQVSPNAPIDALANYIIENPERFNKRPEKKRSAMPDELEPIVIDLLAKKPKIVNGKLIELFMQDFSPYIEKVFRLAAQKNKENKAIDNETVTQLISQHFPLCRAMLISHLVEEFSGDYLICAWICLFVESKVDYLIRRYFAHIEDVQWGTMITLMPNPRKPKKWWPRVPTSGPIATSFQEFVSALQAYKDDYPELFDKKKDVTRFVENISQIELKEREVECQVCFSKFPLNSSVFCFAEWNERENNEPDMILIDDLPSSTKNTNVQQKKSNKTWTLPGIRHAFCIDCFVGQAKAATTDMPLANGGIGLPCMANNCRNPVLFSEYRSFIPPDVRRQLNSRIAMENISLAKLSNLERCHECNYAIMIEVPKDQLRVFTCLRCDYEYCRLCERPWKEDHFGKRCEEVDHDEKANKRHNIEDQLSNVLIRKCHRCQMPFVKDYGCNRMVCRCQATQCYLCRAKDVQYDHFCQHFRMPNQKKCNACNKTCFLWVNPENKDRAELAAIRKDAARQGIDV